MEKGLQYLISDVIHISDYEKQAITENIIHQIIRKMCVNNPGFSQLFRQTFMSGSCGDRLKIKSANEYDIDIALRIPKSAGAVLRVSNRPGYVHFILDTFHALKRQNPLIYQTMRRFVDRQNFLLAKEFRETFFQSLFDRTLSDQFELNLVRVDGEDYEVTCVPSFAPAKTITIRGPGNFLVSVDLVPCFIVDANQWPKGNFQSNPCTQFKKLGLNDIFFFIPKSPDDEPLLNKSRYFRLSFPIHEKFIIAKRQNFKPTIKIMKLIRDVFNQKVPSYFIKTMFLLELQKDSPKLSFTPKLWHSSLSDCLIHMLGVYSKCLKVGRIPYFWDQNVNLLEYLSNAEKLQYSAQIEQLLKDIRADPSQETILRYLDVEE